MNYSQYRVGEIRPSQLLFTYGIGAITDLPQLSVMIMGLDEWEVDQSQELYEERLLAAVRLKLGKQVKRLLPPPIVDKEEDEVSLVGVPVAPFPSWMVCPRCRLLAPLESKLFGLKYTQYRPNEVSYVHSNCQGAYKKEPTVIPVRFLVACSQGHLDEFPWLYFVHRGQSDCLGPLKFEEYGVSGATTEIAVRCTKCEQLPARTLSDAFGENGKLNMPRCRGRNPHLRDFDDDCKEQMQTILLGASNSWFSATLSALSLPKNTSQLEQLVSQFWNELGETQSIEELKIMSRAFAKSEFKELTKYSIEDIWQVISKKNNQGQTEEIGEIGEILDLKTPEWQVFSQADVTLNTNNFRLNPVDPPVGFEKYFGQTVLLEKLREVRALIGFTRIQSPGDFADESEMDDIKMVSLSCNNPIWVPACETRGEGIFLQLEESVLQKWEESIGVANRSKFVKLAHKDWLNKRNLDPKKFTTPSMRYLLLHSLAHALIRQFSITCGYNSASLRERIYSKKAIEENGPQAGILIYTSSSDSEGTMGGLVSLGNSISLGYHLAQALEQVKLCSSDPLCSEHDPSSDEGSLHWVACHSCLFTPETSCERGNKFLDRVLLVPTLSNEELAFFD